VYAENVRFTINQKCQPGLTGFQEEPEKNLVFMQSKTPHSGILFMAMKNEIFNGHVREKKCVTRFTASYFDICEAVQQGKVKFLTFLLYNEVVPFTSKTL
jgi:hypothetical protein